MIERTFIQQNLRKVELEDFVKKSMDRAGVTQIEVQKTPLVTRIIASVTHPGLAIGKGGSTIRKLTQDIQSKFKIENPQIEIKEIMTPDLDARAVSAKMKNLIERGYSWRSVVFKTMRDISSKGSQGIEIIMKGTLGGKGQRKRKQRFAEGYMKKTGDQVKLVDFAKITSYPKYGAIGIKIRIVHPDTMFADKIDVKQAIENFRNPKTVTVEAPKAVEKMDESDEKTVERKEATPQANPKDKPKAPHHHKKEEAA